jgi:hypothetical protein
MADNIVGGLFGVDPASFQRQQQAREYAQDYRAVQLTPLEQSKLAILQGSRAFGRGVGSLLGMEDPELQKVSAIKQLSTQFDLTSPVGMREFARALQQDAPNEAMMAAQRADEMEKSGLGLQKTQLDIQRTEGTIAKEQLSASQEEKLRAELSALPPNASEQDVISIVTKYGSPDKILQVLQRSQDAKLRRAEIAATKGAAPAKPLSAGLQKSEDADLAKIDNLTAQANALAPSIQNLTKNEKGVRALELNPSKIALYSAQNFIGNSSPESLKYAALKSAVDTAVNLQVSNEKGVQTDKDVLRFANALIAAYGKFDSEATLEALKNFNNATLKAKKNTENIIQSRRKQQKVDPYEFAPETTPTTQPAAEKKTRTLKSGLVVTIED